MFALLEAVNRQVSEIVSLKSILKKLQFSIFVVVLAFRFVKLIKFVGI